MGRVRDRLDQHQGPSLGSRRKRAAFAQGIGSTRGGRISKIQGPTDAAGRPRILLISSGNLSDMTMAPALIEAARGRFDADCGYDSNAIRAAIQAQGAEVVIPSTASRRTPYPLDRRIYRRCNVIEGPFGRLKNWRRISTRYDRHAQNYLAAIALVAVVAEWLK